MKHSGLFLLLLAGCQLPIAEEPADAEAALEGATWITAPASGHPLSGASWHWVAAPGAAPPTAAAAPVGRVTLRARVELDSAPPDARFWIAADNSAEVRINGSLIGRSDDWASPVALPAADALRPGRNDIELRATNGVGTGDQNPAGVLAALELGEGRAAPLSWSSPDGAVVELGPASMAPWGFRAPDGPCPLFRREFTVEPGLRAARLAVTGLGHYRLRLDGAPLGEEVIGQAWSQYDERIYTKVYALDDLAPGRHALGVMLGNGFWRVAAPPAGRWSKGDAMPDLSEGQTFLLRAALQLDYADGRRVVVGSGPDWRTAPGPVTVSHIFAGEDYDARRWPDGWDEPGFDDRAWDAAAAARAPAGRLALEDFPALAEHEVFSPAALRRVAADRWSYLFEQNCSALVRFRVRGAAGDTVQFKLSEVITEDGVVEQLNLHGTESVFRYTLRGGGPEEHQPLFHYHGGQFLELLGGVPAGQPNPDGLPVVEAVELVHVRAANPETGSFAASDPLYGEIHDLVDWAMRSNMSWVLTDCPHREKLGWLECAHLLARGFLYRYDCADWYAKIARDLADAQLEDGRILTVAPRFLQRGREDAYAWTVEWGAAGVLVPWELYLWDGDLDGLRERYPTMERFVDHLAAIAPDGIAPGSLGDWYDYGHGQPPGPSRFTPTDLSATACWAMCLRAVEQSARLLGDEAAAARHRAQYEAVRAAFLDRFYDAEAKVFQNGGSPQTAHAMALCADLVPEADRGAVLGALVDDLEARAWQQTAGDVGHLFFHRALAEAGRSDLLHRVYTRTGVGSYGGILAKDLTAMPETWDAITVGSNSLNHCMLGHVVEWYYGWVLGMRQAPGSAGWREALLAPEPGGLEWARGATRTPLGELRVEWRVEDGAFVLEAEVPAGMTATAVVPAGFDGPVLLDGLAVEPAAGPDGRRAVALGPGSASLRAAR